MSESNELDDATQLSDRTVLSDKTVLSSSATRLSPPRPRRMQPHRAQ
ncbi:MAG: hypothetical protein ACLUT3_06020 [Bifidobacterium bifidum]